MSEAKRTDKLHSIKSAAEFLGVIAESTIRVWLWKSVLHRVKVGRRTLIRESELRALIHEEIVPADVPGPTKGRSASSRPAPSNLEDERNA
jgi:hypothetical protein